MFRIDDPSAAAALPIPEAVGTEGYWTEGNPGTGVPATLERASWFNMLQEELRAIVVAGGLTPSKTTYNQVLLAINALALAPFTGTNVSLASSGFQKLPSGFIIQKGSAGLSTAGDVTTTVPIAFPNSFDLVLVTQQYTPGSSVISYAGAAPAAGSKTQFVWHASSSGQGYNFIAIGS